MDIASPGVGIYSTMPGGGYGFLQGTSMATPVASSLVGLLISHGDTDPMKTVIDTSDKLCAP